MFERRIARDNGLGLTIHSLVDTDVGIYQCVLTRFTKQPTKPEHGSTVKVVVNVSPRITHPINDDVVFRNIGSEVSIDCRAEGAPPPEITWSKNDKIISVSPVLQISNLTESDKGRYTCLAANIEGRSTSTVDIKFTKATTLDLVPTNKTVVEGANIFWHCHANNQPEAIVYNWLFENKPIKTTPAGLRASIRTGDLSLQDVRKTDSGWYTCEVRNSRGEMTHSSAFLHVYYAPEASASHQPVQTIASGKDATVVCDVEADPMPSLYTWSKNGHFHTTTMERALKIQNSRPGDGGIYGCQTENIAGKSLVIETHVIVAGCSTLRAPSRVVTCGVDEVCWTPVEEANSYRVEVKPQGSRDFRPLAEVFEEYYRFGPEGEASSSFDVRVRSIRPAYNPSGPSPIVHMSRASGVASSQPGTETFYEPSLRLLDEAESEWKGPRDETLRLHYPQSLIEYEYEIGDEMTAPVDDMLRDKYIYGAQDFPPQLFNDLRIERLRREFKQSQL
ncbi:unnamed protein product [Caenorhabditis auriculariae]|uniref:Ig-like domain-containing protein n=1 Tax=Caenorhabditis auriculariae TaxID=2777116 RepID=A0A8S1GR38_9PELO|nr:unnamed protein product [Caenorhabditis auriculariae]